MAGGEAEGISVGLAEVDRAPLQAEDVCRRIVDLYRRPNLTADQFRAALEANEFDPLKEFSTACRSELLTPPRSA